MSSEGLPSWGHQLRPIQRPDWLVLILVSPSGAGKTTQKNRLLGAFPELRFSVSHTTRRPRPTEAHGREYYFVARGEFEAMVSGGAFAEHAEVHGNLYGTSLGELGARPTGQCGVVLDVDYQGARQIRAHVPDAVTVFVLPPSFEELERRLRGRADEGEDSIRLRLAYARRELEHYPIADYLVVNDDLERASGDLASIVRAERCRRRKTARLAETLLREDAGPKGAAKVGA